MSVFNPCSGDQTSFIACRRHCMFDCKRKLLVHRRSHCCLAPSVHSMSAHTIEKEEGCFLIHVLFQKMPESLLNWDAFFFCCKVEACSSGFWDPALLDLIVCFFLPAADSWGWSALFCSISTWRLKTQEVLSLCITHNANLDQWISALGRQN